MDIKTDKTNFNEHRIKSVKKGGEKIWLKY